MNAHILSQQRLRGPSLTAARMVIAACERRGFDLEVTGPRAAGIRDLTSADVAEPEPVIEPEAGLW